VVIQEIFDPVEIKRTASPDKKMIRNFDVLSALGKKTAYGSLICLTENILPLTQNVNAISIWDI
jgi:hypothetical protein